MHLDSYLTSKAKLALHQNDPDTVIRIIGAEGPDGCFPTYASDRTDLMDLWRRAQELKAEIEAGESLSALRLKQVREANPVPANIGCSVFA